MTFKCLLSASLSSCVSIANCQLPIANRAQSRSTSHDVLLTSSDLVVGRGHSPCRPQTFSYMVGNLVWSSKVASFFCRSVTVCPCHSDWGMAVDRFMAQRILSGDGTNGILIFIDTPDFFGHWLSRLIALMLYCCPSGSRWGGQHLEKHTNEVIGPILRLDLGIKE